MVETPRGVCVKSNKQTHNTMNNFKLTPEQLTAVKSVLDFTTPSALLASVDVINQNIGRTDEDSPLAECLQRDAFESSSIQWDFEQRSSIKLKDLYGPKLDEVHAYLENNDHDAEADYKLGHALLIYGTPRTWLCEQLQKELAGRRPKWDNKVNQMVANIEVVDVIERHARDLELRISDLCELSTKAMRDRMSWVKRTAQECMNEAASLKTKMRTGYELTLDDMRKLDELAGRTSSVDTHGMQWDRKKAINRLLNDKVTTFHNTAKTWLAKLDIDQREEDTIVEKLVEQQEKAQAIKSYHVDNKVVMSALVGMLSELSSVTNVMTRAGWSRDSIQEDIESAKQALSDLAQVRDLFIERLSDEAKEELAKVSIEDIISQLDALAGVVAESNQETAAA